MFVSVEGTILHADLDAFYASVEQRDNPRLRGRPVIVGSGVVLASSYEARACGVRTAMNGRQAYRLCPQAIVVPPRMTAYVAASRAVFEVFAQTTPVVEGLSIDEAFLEVGGLRRLRGAPSGIARDLRRDVLDQVGLPISVGVARTKFLAKVASGVAKPDGILVVPTDAELEFLHPLPVERLWGVGTVTSATLRAARIRTVGDLAARGEKGLVSLLGPGVGRHLHDLAHNHDARRVQVGRRRGSVGAQHSLGRTQPSPAELDAVLLALVDRVCRRLRAGGRTSRTVTIRLRFGDFARATRSHTLPVPTARTQVVLDTARELLRAARPSIERRGVTLLGVAVGGLDDGPEQLALPFDGTTGAELDTAVDAVQDRFGTPALSRAVQLGRDHGPAAPLLPD